MSYKLCNLNNADFYVLLLCKRSLAGLKLRYRQVRVPFRRLWGESVSLSSPGSGGARILWLLLSFPYRQSQQRCIFLCLPSSLRGPLTASRVVLFSIALVITMDPARYSRIISPYQGSLRNRICEVPSATWGNERIRRVCRLGPGYFREPLFFLLKRLTGQDVASVCRKQPSPVTFIVLCFILLGLILDRKELLQPTLEKLKHSLPRCPKIFSSKEKNLKFSARKIRNYKFKWKEVITFRMLEYIRPPSEGFCTDHCSHRHRESDSTPSFKSQITFSVKLNMAAVFNHDCH